MTAEDASSKPIAAHPWEREAHTYNKMHQRLQIVLEEVIKFAPRSVFELGPSVGVLRAALLRRLPGLRYFACDASRSAVQAINDPHVLCVDLNRDALPFAGQTFDCIAGSGIIEYIADVPALLAGLRQRLRPGGRLIISYFNMWHIYRRVLLFRGHRPYRSPTWRNDYFVSEIRELLRTAGFVVCDQIPTDIGLGRYREMGQERWSPKLLRWLRRLPRIGLFTHTAVFVADARDGVAAADAPARKGSSQPCPALASDARI
jgi:SAM-dependent methyltransferase